MTYLVQLLEKPYEIYLKDCSPQAAGYLTLQLKRSVFFYVCHVI